MVSYKQRAAKNWITILKNVATKEILGQDYVTGLNYVERYKRRKHLDLGGVFVQIGLGTYRFGSKI